MGEGGGLGQECSVFNTKRDCVKLHIEIKLSWLRLWTTDPTILVQISLGVKFLLFSQNSYLVACVQTLATWGTHYESLQHAGLLFG